MKQISYLFFLCLIVSFMSGCANKSDIEGSKYTILLGSRQNDRFISLGKGISDLARGGNINLEYSSEGWLYSAVRWPSSKKYEAKDEDYDFAIDYSSRIYRARNGLLENDTKKFENIMVLGYLYGYQVHLVVRKNMNINAVVELADKSAIVNVGYEHYRKAPYRSKSATYSLCQSYFQELGIWDKISKESRSNLFASNEFIKDKMDAFWLVSTYPNKYVSNVAEKKDIKILDVYNDELSVGFFEKYPYYSKAIIPANTYPSINHDVITFQDPVLLIAHRDVPDDIVKKLLEIIYSESGISYLTSKEDIAKFMHDNNGTYGISTPLHPGALRYYKEVNLNQ